MRRGIWSRKAWKLQPGAALTRKDIRAIQLAKGAIRAGMETLMQRAGIAASDLEALYIAGGFGRHIRVESAVSIGLIPNLPAERICAIGNAALAGASMLLLSLDLRGVCAAWLTTVYASTWEAILPFKRITWTLCALTSNVRDYPGSKYIPFNKGKKTIPIGP